MGVDGLKKIVEKSRSIGGSNLCCFTPKEDGDDSLFAEFTNSEYCKEHNGYYFCLSADAILAL